GTAVGFAGLLGLLERGVTLERWSRASLVCRRDSHSAVSMSSTNPATSPTVEAGVISSSDTHQASATPNPVAAAGTSVAEHMLQEAQAVTAAIKEGIQGLMPGRAAPEKGT
ncbi:hypothetical protein QJQ45_027619, partial [Haematococcus lacustris]